jgi:hypothetical protein
MKVRHIIKKEETTEREISLPFYFRTTDSVGELFVKVVDEEKAILVRTPEQINGRIAQISATTAERATSYYPIVEELSREIWEATYWQTSLYLKGLAVPEYILSAEDKDDFQNTY